MKVGLPLMKNVLQTLAKGVLIPQRLTTTASAADAQIYKKVLGSRTKIIIKSNEEMDDVMKIVRSLEDSGILLKGVTKTIEREQKNKEVDYIY